MVIKKVLAVIWVKRFLLLSLECYFFRGSPGQKRQPARCGSVCKAIVCRGPYCNVNVKKKKSLVCALLFMFEDAVRVTKVRRSQECWLADVRVTASTCLTQFAALAHTARRPAATPTVIVTSLFMGIDFRGVVISLCQIAHLVTASPIQLFFFLFVRYLLTYE